MSEVAVGKPADGAPGLERRRTSGALRRAPWWLVALGAFIATALLAMLTSSDYRRVLAYLVGGVTLTLVLSLASYAIALVVGLAAGLGRVAQNPILQTLATIYVELVRGIPLLVIILYAHFVVAPWLGTNRQPVLSGILALAFGYGAYLAEIYRAGIESIETGQMEAARSLGLSYRQAMRLVILPQAIRRVLPALGNDFIAMLKDSSLVSALAVAELTKRGQIEAARSFDTFRTFNAVALLYLILTLLLSLGVRAIERRTSRGRA